MNRTVDGMARIKIRMIFSLMVLCTSCGPPANRPVARVISPDGHSEAVLTETGGGATDMVGYHISVGPNGADTARVVARLYAPTRNERAYGVNLHWANDHVLQIQYLKAAAITYSAKTVEVNGHQIDVVLQSGINDPSAPAGTMWLNLQKRP